MLYKKNITAFTINSEQITEEYLSELCDKQINNYIDPINFESILNLNSAILESKIDLDNDPYKEEFIFNQGPNGKWLDRSDENYKFHPVNAIGRLITKNGSFSAALISRNAILTSAHCFHPGASNSDKDFYIDAFFQPHYPNHNIWYKVTTSFVPTGWIAEKELEMDVAIGVIDEIFPMEDYFGIQTSPGDSEYGYTIYGFPLEKDLNGKVPITEGGPSARGPILNINTEKGLIGVDWTDFHHGIDGGPWIYNGRSRSGNFILDGSDKRSNRPFHIIGISSFTSKDLPGVMVSPYFGTKVEFFIKEIIENEPIFLFND